MRVLAVVPTFAARRWLFEYGSGGGYRLRAPRTLKWLNWPEAVRRSQDEPEAGVSLGQRLRGA